MPRCAPETTSPRSPGTDDRHCNDQPQINFSHLHATSLPASSVEIIESVQITDGQLIHFGHEEIFKLSGFAPIFPDTCYHLTHYWPAAADIPVASDNPVHYADAIRYNARTPLQGSLLPLTRLV